MAHIEQTGSSSQTGLQTSSQATRKPSPRVEALLAFFGVTAVVSALYHVRGVPFLERNLAVVAAVLFLYVPALLLWRRGYELEQFALRGRPIGKGLLFYALLVATVLPLFALAYHFWLRHGCAILYRALGSHWQIFLRCPRPIVPSLRLPPEFPVTMLSQLLVVALPEEFFFRGFLLGRLCETMTKPKALVASALIFAVGHYLVTFQPAALAVFFPGLLFGLLRLTTGSILAGTLFHATCNLLIETLHRSLG